MGHSSGRRGWKMATDQARIKSLCEDLYRHVILAGLLIAAAWLFAVFSYYLSRKTGSDWFSRSGSVMALVGAAVTFRLANF
jgi:cytochrome bd-type quinol oxidase subunit 1